MVSGRRGTYYTAFAVLAALLLTVAVLLADPAWSKAAQNGNDSEQTGENTTSSSSSKASGEDTGGATTQKSSSQDKSKASDTNKKQDSKKKANNSSNGDPIAGKTVTVEESSDDQVTNGDVLIISGHYKVSQNQNPSVEIEDQTANPTFNYTFSTQNGDEITTDNNGNLKIVVGPTPSPDINVTDKLVGVSSEGVQKANKNNKNKNKNKNGGKHHGNGKSASNNCAQIFRDRFSLQYDITQNCIISRRGGNNVNPNNNQYPNNQYPNEASIQLVTQPEGQVAGSSGLSQLPFTGGPGLTGVALIAGLAFLGVGAGVSVWRLGGRRERDDD